MNASKEQLDQSTEQLVMRACRRDADAFALLIRRYERVALSVAFAVLGNADLAGDVVQDAFMRAWERLADLNEPARFATWVCGIARNLAIDQHRRSKHIRLSLDAGAAGAGDLLDRRWNPLDEVDKDEQRARVSAAIESLDDVTRPAVILRYFDGLSSKEIGQIVGLSAAAVDMRLSRARQQLKSLLAPTEESTRVNT